MSQFEKVLRKNYHVGNCYGNKDEDYVFKSVQDLIDASLRKEQDREKYQNGTYGSWGKWDDKDLKMFQTDHKVYRDLLTTYNGDFFKLPKFLKDNANKFTSLEKSKSWDHPIHKLTIGFKCTGCGGVSTKEFNSIHIYSDTHIVNAYCRAYDCEPFDYSNGIGKVALKNMGMCEEIRRTWLVRKGLNMALKAQKESITAINQKQMLEILREEFQMPSLYGE
jgi:hypothetical protein